MKIISWDVGIKNLAYCVIDSDNNNCILYWNIINLIPENEHCFISTCKKPAIKSCQYYGKTVCWCDKHESFYKTLQNDPKSKSNLNVLTKPTAIKNINCNNINIDDLRSNMIHKLDLHILPIIYRENINFFLIENQPTLKNPRMKAIADTLYTWALIRCKLDSKIISNIHLISPSNKLKKYAEELMNCENKYKTTKLKSIEVVLEYLDKFTITHWNNHLKTFSKKDDLCDAFLQGLYWINQYNEKNGKSNEKNNGTKKIAKTTKTNKNAKLIQQPSYEL